MAQKSQFNFSGGMNTSVSNLLLKDNEAELILNYILDKVGALKKRLGTKLYVYPGGAYPTGLFQFISSTASNSAILTTSNGGAIRRVYTTTLNGGVSAGATSLVLTDGTNFGATGDASSEKIIVIDGQYITYTTKSTNTLSGIPASGSGSIARAIATGAIVRTTRSSKTETATGKWRFFTFINYVFALNDGVTPRTSSAPAIGSGWGTTNAAGLTITPSIGIVYKDRAYLTGDSTNPNKLYFSSKIDPGDTTITWDETADYIPVDPENGDSIKGLAINANILLVFKEFGTYRWDGNAIDTEPVIDVGTTSHESIQTLHGITFFANRKGVWAYTKGQPKLISRKVQKWWDAIPAANFATLSSWTDQDHYYINIAAATDTSPTITVDGVTYSSGVTLAYNIPLNAWTVETGHDVAIAATITDPDDSGRYVLLHRNTGNNAGVTIHNTGTSDCENTPSVNTLRTIPGQLRTKEFLTNFPLKSQLSDLFVSMQQAVGSLVGYRLDRLTDKFRPVGQCTQRINQFDLEGQANTVQVEIIDNSSNQSIIEGVAMFYDPSPVIDKFKL